MSGFAFVWLTDGVNYCFRNQDETAAKMASRKFMMLVKYILHSSQQHIMDTIIQMTQLSKKDEQFVLLLYRCGWIHSWFYFREQVRGRKHSWHLVNFEQFVLFFLCSGLVEDPPFSLREPISYTKYVLMVAHFTRAVGGQEAERLRKVP